MQNFNLGKKLLIIVMDGFGSAKDCPGNAISQVAPKNLTQLWNNYPHTYLLAASEAVGLPPKTNGNSEVGHLNLGGGRVMYQNLPRINKNIKNGNYFKNETLLKALKHANKNKSNIHLLGCLSDGSIHSHIDHIIATIKFFGESDLDKESSLFVHAFTDGRDSAPKSAKQYLTQLQESLNKYKIGKIGSLCGRSIAMDRNKNWEKTQKAYDMLVKGQGKEFKGWQSALEDAYQSDQTDEFIEPRIINDGEKSIIRKNDVVLFLNFRADRAIQISAALEPGGMNEFPNSFNRQDLGDLFFASMVEYAKDYPHKVIYPKEYIKLPLGRVISNAGLTQLRIAESEKFPHVTYFFNGGRALKYDGENRIEIDSPDVPTYDEQPEMSAFIVTEILKERIVSDFYDFMVLNLANGDMVGHTGDLEASKLAVEVVDYCVGELVKQMISRGGTVIITADHGNVEELINRETGGIDTEHSENPVPFIIVNKKLSNVKLKLGALADVAPTVLTLMGIDIPSEMNGKVLL